MNYSDNISGYFLTLELSTTVPWRSYRQKYLRGDGNTRDSYTLPVEAISGLTDVIAEFELTLED